MKQVKQTSILLAAASVLAVACLEPPKKTYTPDEIATLDSLQEIMRIQAHEADPQMAKRDQTSFTDAEFTALAEMANTLKATSTRLESFGGKGEYDDGFVDYAKKLNQHATAVEAAAGSKDAAAAGKALTEMRSTCKGCHGVYR